MIDEKKEKSKILVQRQTLLHTLQQSMQKIVQDKVPKNNIVKEKANFTVNSTMQNAVKNVLNKTTKNFRYNYKRAKERRQIDDLNFRLDRVLRLIRPHYSSDGYMDVVRALQNVSYFEKLDWINQAERKYDKHRSNT